MNVLSLFDGMSCGQIALNRVGIGYENYFASEVDKWAIKVTQANYPDTIQLGDVIGLYDWHLPQIDLLLGGSPCQGFSRAGKRLNWSDPRSQLFFRYVDALRWLKPKWFLYENVIVKKDIRDAISLELGVEPIKINSALVSAQNRNRYYWTNLSVDQPKDKGVFVGDILDESPPNYTKVTDSWYEWWENNKEFQLKKQYSCYANLRGKAITMTARQYASWNGNFVYQLPRGNNNIKNVGFIKSPSLTSSSWQYNNLIVTPETIRKFSCVECERLQTIPDNYTDYVSNSQRYKMLGNGWTVDVIAHIFEGITEWV